MSSALHARSSNLAKPNPLTNCEAPAGDTARGFRDHNSRHRDCATGSIDELLASAKEQAMLQAQFALRDHVLSRADLGVEQIVVVIDEAMVHE